MRIGTAANDAVMIVRFFGRAFLGDVRVGGDAVFCVIRTCIRWEGAAMARTGWADLGADDVD